MEADGIFQKLGSRLGLCHVHDITSLLSDDFQEELESVGVVCRGVGGEILPRDLGRESDVREVLL